MIEPDETQASSDDEQIVARIAAFVESQQETGDCLYPSTAMARFAIGRWRSFPLRTKVKKPTFDQQVDDLANGLAIRFDRDNPDALGSSEILASNFATIITAGPLIEKQGFWWREIPGWKIIREQCPACGVLAVVLKHDELGLKVEIFGVGEAEWPLQIWAAVFGNEDACFASDEVDKAFAYLRELCERFSR